MRGLVRAPLLFLPLYASLLPRLHHVPSNTAKEAHSFYHLHFPWCFRFIRNSSVASCHQVNTYLDNRSVTAKMILFPVCWFVFVSSQWNVTYYENKEHFYPGLTKCLTHNSCLICICLMDGWVGG